MSNLVEMAELTLDGLNGNKESILIEVILKSAGLVVLEPNHIHQLALNDSGTYSTTRLP